MKFFNFSILGSTNFAHWELWLCWESIEMLPSGKKQVRAVVHELNPKFINKAVPNIEKFHICRLWLFVISRYIWDNVDKVENIVPILSFTFITISLCWSIICFLSFGRHLWSVSWEGGCSGKITCNLFHIHN